MATTTIAPAQAARVARPRQADGESGEAGSRGAGMSWSVLVGGGALALYGLTRGSLAGLGLAALGGGLLYRGVTGRSALSSVVSTQPGEQNAVQVEESLSVMRSPQDLYSFWRNLENLPRFMRYLDSVQSIDDKRSRWVAKGPMDVRAEWDAEITENRPNELIAWRSLPGSTVFTEGSVRFQPEPANRGTRVTVVTRYAPPAGKVGHAIATLFGRSAGQEIREDLRRFKRLLETGEIPTTKGQPSGRGRDPWEQSASMIVRDRFAVGLGWFSVGLGLAELLMPEMVANLAGVSGHHALLRGLGARELASGIGILASRPQPAGWLWGRVAGDIMDLSCLSAAFSAPGAHRFRTLAATASVLGIAGLDLVASLEHSRSATPPEENQTETHRASAS